MGVFLPFVGSGSEDECRMFPLRPFPCKLSLICRECKTRRKYNVGTVSIDPGRMQGEQATLSDAVYFTGLFYCGKCGSAGPWDFPFMTTMTLTTHVFRSAQMKDAPPTIAVVRAQLFDGTTRQTAAMSVEYLKSLLDGTPRDSYIWCRIGNVYSAADRMDLGRGAHRRSVEIDPTNIEARHWLGKFAKMDGHLEEAAEHFHHIVLHARHDTQTCKPLLRDLVTEVLEGLWDMHHESEGEIDFLPRPDSGTLGASQDADEPHVVHLIDFDLSSEDGWNELTRIILGEDSEPSSPRHFDGGMGRGVRGMGRGEWPDHMDEDFPVDEDFDDVAWETPVLTSARRVGRNEPCPCGSGKKFKRCCGRG